MGKVLKSNFVGTGTMVKFCEETNKLFTAIENVVFLMPSGYSGIEPSVKVEDGRIVFDFGQALIFTMNNVVFNLTGSADFNSYAAEVINGQLVISIDAD